MSYFNPNYFSDAKPYILGNEKLRQPQIVAYQKTIDYYKNNPKNRSGLIVLPTGTGKTGVISMIPFGLCEKRTLIIAPSTVIRDGIIEEMTGSNPRNFWNDKNILDDDSFLPTVVEYTKDTTKGTMQKANIVIINIDKAMMHLDSSLLKAVDSDFFDLVIIDEAHHAPAESWANCIKHFNKAKIINLTGTPFRADNQPIDADLIYQYKLSRAMANGYVKSLENIIYVPGELKLTIDNDPKEYTVEEIFEKNIKDSDWVSRSVALSESCSESVVNKSLKLLRDKKSKSSIPHKIIAVACSVAHALQIQSLYESKGVKSAVIHHDVENRDKAFKDIENHRVDVVINVAMLGEGYDHPYLSIAAIFRPFRSELPYAQFIGRVLRKIHETDASTDNIAQIVSHHHLYLEDMWIRYKKEIEEANIISGLIEISDEISNSLDDGKIIPFPQNKNNPDHGTAVDGGDSTLTRDSYLDTELLKRHEKEKAQEEEQIQQIMATLNISDMQAREIILRTQGRDAKLNRPDLIIKQNKKDIDVEIREIIVPTLLEENNIPPKQRSLAKKLDIFTTGNYSYISKMKHFDNAAMLAFFLNAYLKKTLGKGRPEWEEEDFIIAWKELEKMKTHIEKRIKAIQK